MCLMPLSIVKKKYGARLRGYNRLIYGKYPNKFSEFEDEHRIVWVFPRINS